MAGMTADEVYVLLGDEITLLTEEVKQMEGWEPIEHKGTVQTAEDLPADAKKGWMYNIATDSVYGAAGMNVVMTSKGWDPMGPIINMNLYLTKEEGTKSFQPKGNYLSGTDTDLKESGKAADAKATGEKIAKNSSDIAKKLGKNQGSENSGKVAGINEVGDIVPMFPMGVEYNSETNCLEFGSDQKMKLNQGIGLDNTLTKSGSAADAGVTGKKIDSLKEDISTKITKFYASNQGKAHLADSDNGKIVDMMLYGKSEQKQYSGKNLLNYDAWKGVLITRGTAVFEKNSFTLTATENDCYTEPTPEQGFPDDAKIEISEGETVTLSWESSADTDGNIYIFPNGAVTDGLVYTDNHNTKTLTYTAARGVKFITFRFGVAHAGDTISYKNIQIEKGSEATPYEPYTGGIPSPNPDYPQEIKSVVNPTVKVCGKNLVNVPEKLEVIGNKSYTIAVEDKKTYTITLSQTLKAASPTATKVAQHWFRFYNSSGKILKQGVFCNMTFSNVGEVLTKTQSLISPEGAIKLVLDISAYFNNNPTLITNYMQVELGSEATTYEPYHEQTVTLPYTLNAIPVSAGGNVTIDEQQYIADYVDVERGKLVKMVDDAEAKNYTWNLYPDGNNMPRRFAIYDTIRFDMPTNTRIMSFHFKQIEYNARTDLSVWFQRSYIVITDVNEKWKNSEALIQWFSENNVHFYLPLKIPIEIDLTQDEIAAFKALATYYPTTNINVNSEQLDGYTIFNYPISMENGWNYVKQQIGDTRDYIYDMDARTQDIDTQSAEAYVNSEYAVALTELEV